MNRDNISSVVRTVDILISVDRAENILDEAAVKQYINKASDFLKIVPDEEELAAISREIFWKYQVRSTPGESILNDYEQGRWYDDRKSEIDPKFWTRYRDYLIDTQHFSPNVVSTLGDDTLDQKLMNYIGDPHAERPFFKRGLIIGDVQSGKTSTYIGFLCKAADAGYKVFILLTGTIEALRRQTQERVEEGFIGIDMSAEATSGRRVGVGIGNPINAISLTSRVKDFTGDTDKTVISLASSNDAVVFVIKKNTKTLQNLTKWLVTLNADPVTKKIDMPMLMIDDEADNASINTSKDKEDPTKINRLIRELASVFTKANYVGFTATPFANVFIDPETTEKMTTQDLFPEDFIVALPTPSNYIGPNQIFSKDGRYHSQLVYIKDAGYEEADGWSFWFKHTKEWRGELPESLTDAIYAFYIANTLRDLRGDKTAHRSMLINISRFVDVQRHIKGKVEHIHQVAYRSIKFNLSSNPESLKDPVISRLHKVWETYYRNTEFTWEDIAKTMFSSIENIQIKVVNSSKSSERLEYPKNDSLRVIAIGGLALSRGLTLEGLIISYFYRNTSTYDVLMQMGRWFGYRKNYDDLFRIWIHKSSAEWYAEIAAATDKLKDDMAIMRDRGQRPKDFGIRVRNNSADLQITAYNKMRNSTDEYEYSSYFGNMVETPYLHFSAEPHKQNFKAISDFVAEWVETGHSFERQDTTLTKKGRYIIQDIPKQLIIQLLRKLKISRFSVSTGFDVNQIISSLTGTSDPSVDYFDIAFMDGTNTGENNVPVNLSGREIYRVRRTCVVDKDTDRLNIGHRGKMGGPNDGLAGIIDFNGKTATEIVEEAKRLYRIDYRNRKGEEFTKDKTYPSDTWFKFIKDRKPLLMIYFVDVVVDDDEPNQEKQINGFRQKMGETPAVGFMLGLPRNDNEAVKTTNRYKANKIYNWFERDDTALGDDE